MGQAFRRSPARDSLSPMTLKPFYPPDSEQPPQHGGDLGAASEQFGIDPNDWLDLSTGINPDNYPVPTLAPACFTTLPEKYRVAFLDAARHYYGCEFVLAGPGSQRFIELLPCLRDASTVGVPDIGYAEHAYRWRQAGHQVVTYDAWKPAALDTLIEEGRVDCAVIINPGNPTAKLVSRSHLRQWHRQLDARGGWLIIDEAFIDATPDKSYAPFAHERGVVVLRSIGKYFGLAGIRCGFAICHPELGERLDYALGPWPVTGPSQHIVEIALGDHAWQRNAARTLLRNSRWMQDVVVQHLGMPNRNLHSTGFFVGCILKSTFADHVFTKLAGGGILIRRWPLAGDFAGSTLLRFGLISSESVLLRDRFHSALAQIER
jgi:cobalamin biosynthesis protein CobC